MKNNYEIIGDTIHLEVYYKKERFEVLVSKDKLPILLKCPNRWYINTIGYVQGWEDVDGKRVLYSIHRELMGNPKGMVIDHKNHDKLDNRDSNLRIVTHAQNAFNKDSRKLRGKSNIRHIYWCSQTSKWRVRITKYGKHNEFGRYADLEDAKEAVKAGLKKLGYAY